MQLILLSSCQFVNGSLIKTNRKFVLTIINLFWSDSIQVLKVVVNERLQQLYRSKLLSIILEMIMLLEVGLLELDELVSFLGNFVIMTVPQIKKLIFDGFVLFSKIGVQVFSEVFFILFLLNLVLCISLKPELVRINKNIPRLLERNRMMTVKMIDLIFYIFIDQLFLRE